MSRLPEPDSWHKTISCNKLWSTSLPLTILNGIYSTKRIEFPPANYGHWTPETGQLLKLQEAKIKEMLRKGTLPFHGSAVDISALSELVVSRDSSVGTAMDSWLVRTAQLVQRWIRGRGFNSW